MILNLEQIFLKSNLKTQLLKNNIQNIKELILKKPKKYEKLICTNLEQISSFKEINVFGFIADEPIIKKNSNNFSTIQFNLLLNQKNKIKVIYFNNSFFLPNY